MFINLIQNVPIINIIENTFGSNNNDENKQINNVYNKNFNFKGKLYGGFYLDYYYSIMKLGNQYTSVIMDTGSDLITFPCNKCKKGVDCGNHEFYYYNADEDKNFKDIKTENDCYFGNFQNRMRLNSSNRCLFSVSYAEGSSLNGFYFESKVKFYKKEKNSILGCTIKEKKLFKTQFANGIFGIGNDSQFLNSLEKKNNLKKINLSLCISSIGGYYGFNNNLSSLVLNNSSLKTIKYGQNQGFMGRSNYYVKLSSFFINNDKFNLQNNDLLIDSGTTYSYFPKKLYNKIKLFYKNFCEKNKKHCLNGGDLNIDKNICLIFDKNNSNFKSPLDILKTLPIISLNFDKNQVYKLYPEEYFYPKYSQTNFSELKKLEGSDYNGNIINNYPIKTYCLSIESTESDNLILGAFNMINYVFKFNRIEKKISFQRAECNKKVISKDHIRI